MQLWDQTDVKIWSYIVRVRNIIKHLQRYGFVCACTLSYYFEHFFVIDSALFIMNIIDIELQIVT